MALSLALPLSGLERDAFASFDLKDILTGSRDSPSPSSSSESSGLGSLGSLPPSPHDDKALFAEKATVPHVKVMYGGKDILDLKSNIDPAGWEFRYAYLPPNNASYFFANRSQYHRLGGYPEVEFTTEDCPVCGFKCIKL